MTARAQSVQRGANNAPVVRPSRTALAGPTQSESEQRLVIAVTQAYSLVCDAANTFDLKRARQALADAANLMVVDDSVDGVVTMLDQVLRTGTRPSTRNDVANAVASLVGAYPNFGSKAEGRLFGATLAEDLAAAEPTIMALDMMVRKLRRSTKFVPAISEVLETLEVIERRLDRGWTVVDQLAERWDEARARVEKLTTDHSAWVSKQVTAYRNALAAGGDVRGFSADVIAAANPPDEEVPF